MQAFYSYARLILQFNCYMYGLQPCVVRDIELIENVQKCFTR